MMSKKIIFLLLTIFIGFSSSSQNSINDYKYVVVPLQFDFLKGKDKYRTSTLTRYLFKKEGFEVYFDEEELPQDLFNDRCLAMYADLVKQKSFLGTKLQIELKDCNDNIVLKSEVGRSKLKEFNKAYLEAIKDAFKSIEFLNYKYNFNTNVGSKKQAELKAEELKEHLGKAKAAREEVERLKQEVEELKKQKEQAKAESELKTKQEAEAKKDEAKRIEKQKLENVEQNTKVNSEVYSDLFYAQSIDKGFQLVDATPKVVMVLIKTAAPNVYTVKGKDAIVFKDGDTWFYSENNRKKALNIKF